MYLLGSIPEQGTDDKLYNTCTVYDPEGRIILPLRDVVTTWYCDCAGNLVAMHRKVHLFDIDVPGKIKFKVRKPIARAGENW